MFKRILFSFVIIFMLGSLIPTVVPMSFAADASTITSAADKAKAAIASLDRYFINLIVNIREPLVFVIGIVAFIMGIFMEMFAINRLTKPGLATNKGSTLGTFGMMIIGAMLISLPSTINVIERSFFEQSQVEMNNEQSWKNSDLTYLKSNTADDEERNDRVLRAINAAFQYVRIFGLIAFVRGLYLMKAVMDGGQATLLNGSLHMIGGVLAMHIAPVLRIFFKTVNG